MVKVKINTENVKLAIEASSLKKEYIAKRMNKSVKIIEKWISGQEKEMTFSEAVKLGEVLGVNPNIFFLNKPYQDLEMPADFRLKKGAEKLGIKSIKNIRNIIYLQETLYDIMSNLNINTSTKIETANLNSDPSVLASKYREILGIEDLIKKKMKDEDFFEEIRSILFDMNIIVIIDNFPDENVKGLSLSSDKISMIVINSSDTNTKSRIFTLFHEFAHLLLKNNILCDASEGLIDENTNGNIYEIERWCNKFSANILIPPEIIKKEFKGTVDNEKIKRIAGRISSKYHVSKSTIYYALLDNHIIDRTQLNDLLPGVNEKKEKGGRGLPLEKRRIKMYGKDVSKLIFYAHDEKVITTRDVLSIFSIKLDDLSRVRNYAIK